MQNSNPQSKSSTRKWIKSSMVQQYGSTCLWPGLLDFDINFRSVAWNSFQCKCFLKNLPYFSFSDDQMMVFYTCVTKRGFSFDMQSSRVYQVWVCHITVTIIRWFTLFLINFARTWHIMQKTKHNLELDSNFVVGSSFQAIHHLNWRHISDSNRSIIVWSSFLSILWDSDILSLIEFFWQKFLFWTALPHLV